MPILCENLDTNIVAIVAMWKASTDRPPWNSLPDAEWADHLPSLLRAMIEGAVCVQGSRGLRRSVVEQGTIHGENRRKNHLSLEIILDEASLLRAAVWRFLTTSSKPGQESTIMPEILRLDGAIGVATLASFAGFHRQELERVRPWSETIDELLANWERTTFGGQ